MIWSARFMTGFGLGFEFFGAEAMQTVFEDAKGGLMLDLFILHIVIAFV